MNPTVGWALAVAAVAAGYAAYGWPGVALGVSVVVFWLLLQFSQALRLMRTAAKQPVGRLQASALMLHTKMLRGQRLADLMKMTGSFGAKAEVVAASNASTKGPPAALANEEESFVWTDDGGDALHVTLRAGKVDRWTLLRAPSLTTTALTSAALTPASLPPAPAPDA